MRKLWFALTLVLAFVLVGCAMPAFSSSAQHEQASEEESPFEEEPESEPEPLGKKPLNDYSWDDLSQISAQISAAESDEARREVARAFGVVEEDGTLTRQTKQIVLDDTRALDVRIAGIGHDDKADGSGKAGITFMTVGAIDILPMNDEATVVGGWEASRLRSVLNGEQKQRLDEDLRAVIVPVNKLTNNVGITESFESVTPTADELWVFSVHEVCGDVTWDRDEFRGRRGWEDVDGLLNSEGMQYEAFAREGVTGESDPNGFLSLANSTGKSPWWYRTPYPFEFNSYGNTGCDGYFYQVMDSGFPKSRGNPQEPASVVVGFCV